MGGAAAIALIIVVAILVAAIRRRARARADAAPLPLIPFASGRGATTPLRPDPVSPTHNAARSHTNAPTPAWTSSTEEPNGGDRPRSSYAPPTSTSKVTPPAAAVGSSPLADTARPNEMVDGTAVDGASVRYWRPADGTLQFLPGRLEVIAGRDAGQEIRFVRTPGPDGTRVTFGRAEGVPYRHVQLREPTVSRTHARMILESNGAGSAASSGPSPHGPRWRLENLSATNPVVVNGQPLAADGTDAGSVRLGEGDRIEMGEVVFRFHEK